MSITPLSAADLEAYLARIGHHGPLNPDLATLRALCAGHARAIAFENIEVQQGRQPSMAPDALVEKLVRRRRGGWCYEQNGLFGRVLATIGFRIMRICGGGAGNARDLLPMGSHLSLLVQLDRMWLADVGFGSWLNAPIPLEEGQWDHAPFTASLSRTPANLWCLEARMEATPISSFEFAPVPADEARLATACRQLANAADSIFVQNLLAQRRTDTIHYALRGRVLVETDAGGERRALLESPEALAEALRDIFGLDVPEVDELWDGICARHDDLFGTEVAPANG